jgi:ELWxxDGT repeat protein
MFLANVNGTLFFTAVDGSNGKQVWRSDGTTGGTTPITEINLVATNAYPSGLTNVNGTLFFSATDGTHGTELWESIGTAAGTRQVKDINAGAAGSYPSYLTAAGGTLFFSATDGIRGRELWKSNGTILGTALVRDINVTSPGAAPHLSTAPNTPAAVNQAPVHLAQSVQASPAPTFGPAAAASNSSHLVSAVLPTLQSIPSRLVGEGQRGGRLDPQAVDALFSPPRRHAAAHFHRARPNGLPVTDSWGDWS